MNNKIVRITTTNIMLAAAVAVLLAGCDSTQSVDTQGDANTGGAGTTGNLPGATLLADLKIGDCASTTVPHALFVSEMAVTDCREAHGKQVAGRFTFPEASDAAYPGFLAVQQGAYGQCQPVFEQFTGVAFWDSPYDIDTITPSASSWADGDRTAICLVVTIDGAPLTTATRAPMAVAAAR